MVLRRLTEADLDDLAALDADPEVMRHLTGGRPTPREVIRDRILPAVLDDYERSPGFGRFAAIERATGEFLGWFSLLRDEHRRGQASLGYRLRRAAWGRGLATEGSRALIRLAFAELGVERVVATTMAVNVASRRVMEKAGMTLARTFYLSWPDPIDGAEHGDVEYAVTAQEARKVTETTSSGAPAGSAELHRQSSGAERRRRPPEHTA